jgi:hypothetical protein
LPFGPFGLTLTVRSLTLILAIAIVIARRPSAWTGHRPARFLVEDSLNHVLPAFSFFSF